ncbi:probable WRKY transcription factor 53 isoform X2 [Malania oleifera]|uniref:probable WRKY transcription factor 53 isoform X2 n=1 Tax=Malania oleifera TaxID=397392 RepID=UPI0025ADD43C|nr:probable WRKY transcription factor 53 isoform X2 [Malania oleifera]
MENGWSWEHKALINELTQGMELAKQLRFQLNSASSAETREYLVQGILSSYEKALQVLIWGGSARQPQPPELTISVPESPISVNESPQSEDLNRSLTFKDFHHQHKEVSKKRKMSPKWTDKVRVCSENGFEAPLDDGYSWRKYGQKDILGAKYPRCTYRHIHDCWATKMVQRSDEDPSIFDITYKGTHTCTQANQPVPAPTSPEKQEQKQITNHHSDNQQLQSKEFILNFRASTSTEELENKDIPSPFSFPLASFASVKSENNMFTPSMLDNTNLTRSYSPQFISPATSESNYLSVSPCGVNGIGGFKSLQHSESDHAEIISANTSATNSPMPDLDFSLEQLDFGSFPFDTPGFFS